MKTGHKIIMLLWMATVTIAYTNDTMTTPYLELTNNDPIHAIMHAYDSVWGDWFYMILAFGPFISMWIYQRDSHLPVIWLTCIMVSYGFLFEEVKQYVFYLVTAVWFGHILIKLVSPIYKS